MERRRFLKDSFLGGGGLGASLLFQADPNRPGARPPDGRSASHNKVKMAMLAMQRDAWEQGVAAQAMLENGDEEMVILLAKDAVVRQVEDGRLAVISCWEGVTDPAANGEALLFAAEKTGDERLRLGAQKMIEYLLKRAPRTKDGTLYHVSNKPQVWVDSMFMAPPFIALAGYPEEAVKQVEGIRRILWNPTKKLFSHNWDDGRGEFIRRDFWGVGNGWAAAGMARVINALRPGMVGEKRRLIGYVKEVVDGCLIHQRDDGLFHDFVDNPGTFVETNLAQMLAYTIYRGVRAGWLESSYLQHAGRMRNAARNKVDGFGLVQGVCGSPNFDSPGTATEGQAFFLLMEAAARDAGRRN